MFTIPAPITVVAVKDFTSDEVHITGKASGNPRAVLSFLAVDTEGKAVPSAPVAVVTLTGEAFNTFYAAWNSEQTLYSSLLTMLGSHAPGMTVTGVDLAKVAGVLTVTANAEEVVAET